MKRKIKNWGEVAYAICKQAAHIAYEDKRIVETPEEMKEGDIYINEIGKLWKEKSHSTDHQQVFVSPVYLIKAARVILDAEEIERHKNRTEQTNDHTSRGLALGFISNIKNSWKEIENAYRSMHSFSWNETSSHDRETLHDLRQFADALEAATDNLQNFTNRHKKEHLKISKVINYHFCPLCWRHVFKTNKNYSANERCSIHKDSKSSDYEKAVKLKSYVKLENRITIRDTMLNRINDTPVTYATEDYLPQSEAQHNSEFEIEFKRIRMKVLEFQKEEHQRRKPTATPVNLTEFYYPTDSFDPETIPIQPVELNRLWEFFKNTASYAQYHRANLKDLRSVLKTLDDKTDPTGMREKIHTAYTRAPMLALDFLMHVEVWRTLNIKQGFRGKK